MDVGWRASIELGLRTLSTWRCIGICKTMETVNKAGMVESKGSVPLHRAEAVAGEKGTGGGRVSSTLVHTSSEV